VSEVIMTDVERFARDRCAAFGNEPVTATELYEEYCSWCEERGKDPMALPTFGREFGELGAQKAKIDGRVRYVGVAALAATLGRA
jgi:phage/plasmid-associated DNA primase